MSSMYGLRPCTAATPQRSPEETSDLLTGAKVSRAVAPDDEKMRATALSARSRSGDICRYSRRNIPRLPITTSLPGTSDMGAEGARAER